MSRLQMINIRSTCNIRFTIDVTLPAISIPTESPTLSWNQMFRQSGDQYLPDGVSMKNELYCLIEGYK